jgi:hypothetical protein
MLIISSTAELTSLSSASSFDLASLPILITSLISFSIFFLISEIGTIKSDYNKVLNLNFNICERIKISDPGKSIYVLDGPVVV